MSIAFIHRPEIRFHDAGILISSPNGHKKSITRDKVMPPAISFSASSHAPQSLPQETAGDFLLQALHDQGLQTPYR